MCSGFYFAGLLIGPFFYFMNRTKWPVFGKGFVAGIVVGYLGVAPCLLAYVLPGERGLLP